MIRQHVQDKLDCIQILKQEIKDIQDQCPHEIAVYQARGSTGNWDRDDSYWYNHYCYDCQKRWTTDQTVRPTYLKVDSIDYDENPVIIEYNIKINQLKRT